MSRRSRAGAAALTATTLLAISAVVFIVGQALRGDSTTRALPGDSVATDDVDRGELGSGPASGVDEAEETATSQPLTTPTPDRSQPGWFRPYLEREQNAPKLNGMVNGIEVGQEPTTPDEWSTVCASPEVELGPEAEQRHADSELTITDQDLPAGMEMFERPVFSVCPDFGVIKMQATVRVPIPVEGGSPGSGVITVFRFHGKAAAGVSGSVERWSADTVGGLPAATLRPVVDAIGDSTIIVYESEANVTTWLYGGGLYLESLEVLMEAILR